MRTTSRANLFEAFKRNPEHFAGIAKTRGIPLAEVFRIEAPDAEKHWPREALHDIMARDGLRVQSDRNYAASTIGDFFKDEYRVHLLYAYLDDMYERAFWGNQATRADDSGSAQTEFSENEIYRPYNEVPLMEKKRIAPQVRLRDLIARTETIPEDLIRETDYDVPTVDETMASIAEGTRIPVVQMRLSSETQSMKKVGIGLEITDEFMTNPTRITAVRIWVERVATTHEISLVKEAVNTIRDQAVAADATGTPLTEDLDGLIKVSTEFEEPYVVNMLISDKSQARAWIKTHVESGGSGGNGGVGRPIQAFNPLFPDVQLVNMAESPQRLAHVSGTKLATGEMLGVDTRAVLVLYRQARGSVNERDRIPGRQVEARYLTERYGFVVEDENPIIRYTT